MKAATKKRKRSKAAGTRRGGHARSENVRLVLAVAAVLIVMGSLFWFRVIY